MMNYQSTTTEQMIRMGLAAVGWLVLGDGYQDSEATQTAAGGLSIFIAYAWWMAKEWRAKRARNQTKA